MFTFPISLFNAPIVGGVNLTYVSNGDTNGLVYYLGTNNLTTTFSNPHPSKLSISASSNLSGGTSVPDILSRLVGGNLYYSANVVNESITVTLVNNTINLTHYSIRTRNDQNNNQLRSWKLQGSNNNSTYVDLDIKTNNTTIVGINTWHTFPIPSSTFYKYIKLINTGVDSSGSNFFLCIGGLEFYGQLS